MLDVAPYRKSPVPLAAYRRATGYFGNLTRFSHLSDGKAGLALVFLWSWWWLPPRC
ncbi:hypothetical protein O9992_12710 [Vibrio lentus]|nr:hypothetical protein [Vibrio lentus]